MAKSPAPAPETPADPGAFNGADPVKFDRDGDRRPGGRLPDGFVLGEDGVTVVESATGKTWPDAVAYRAERDAATPPAVPGAGEPANAVRVPLICLATGAVLLPALEDVAAATEADPPAARLATAQDLEIAGRRDLIPLIIAG